MAELSTKQRNSLNNSTFGIPSLRKYPLNDKEHVLKAIQFFHHCPIEYKKELANNINKKAKEYDIIISKDSNIYEYLNEESQIEIDNCEDIYLLERSLYLNEAFGVNEEQAQGTVNTAISLWKKRKSFIRTYKDKNRMLMDIKTEKSALDSLQDRRDFNGVIQRAKMTANTMSKKISTGEYQTIKKIKGKSKYKGSLNPHAEMAKTIGSIGGTFGASIALAKVGTKLGGASAIKHGSSKPATVGRKLGGAGLGLAAGTVLGAANIARRAIKQNAIKAKSIDPERPIRQCAERYINFISNLQSDVLGMEINPNGDKPEEQENGGEY